VKIRVEDLAYAFKTFSLRIGGLAFEEGLVTSVVGPNGAGKTTLLRLLAGLLAPQRGRVLVDGRDLAGLGARNRAGCVGYVPQEPAFTFNYSVLDFVLTGRAAYIPAFSSPARADAEACREALGIVGLSGFEERTFLELSSGERRLVLIARTLAQRPAILLLDEPTTFLDPRHEVEIMELLGRLAAGMGKTVVVTLHALDMAVKCSDLMVFMKGGGVVAAGRPGEVLDEALLRSVYDIEMGIVHAAGRQIIVR
jgi:iron complex transport system ATP-binding protein